MSHTLACEQDSVSRLQEGCIDMSMREITQQHKLGLITQGEMYDRLILAQLDKCETTGSADDYWRLDRLVSIAKSRRGDS